MILFKSCPRCSTGDLIEARDGFGRYVECMQCGYIKDIPSLDERRLQPVSHGAAIPRSA